MTKLQIAGTKENAAQILNNLEQIILAEKENVEATIPLVQVDSILGYEPSMDYTTNEACLRWKLKQLDVELIYRIPMLKQCNAR